MVDGDIETRVGGAHGVIIPEMPFAEQARAVAVLLKYFGHRERITEERVAPFVGGPRSVVDGIPSGHDRAPSGGANGAHVKVGEPHHILVESIEMGRLNPRVTVGTEVTNSLIIGENEDDVGLVLRGGSKGGE